MNNLCKLYLYWCKRNGYKACEYKTLKAWLEGKDPK